MRRGNGPDVIGIGGGGALPAPPPVQIDVCRCGCRGDDVGRHVDGTAVEPEWPLATAWAFLTRPVDDVEDDGEEPQPADLPWWDARSSASKRRAVLPLVLLGELQAGVLLRAVWEVVQSGSGPTA